MRLHLTLVVARPTPPRPAKVVVLETRRQARLEVARPKPDSPRPPA